MLSVYGKCVCVCMGMCVCVYMFVSMLSVCMLSLYGKCVYVCVCVLCVGGRHHPLVVPYRFRREKGGRVGREGRKRGRIMDY